jgi:hypothetical protein
MEVTGKEIIALVNTVVSTKGKPAFSDKLLNGGRSVKWPNFKITDAQVEKIYKAAVKQYKGAKVVVYHTKTPVTPGVMPYFDGLRVRISLAKQ